MKESSAWALLLAIVVGVITVFGALAARPHFKTGDGVYTGLLVDAEWGGLFWKSCEITQRAGTSSGGHDEKSSSYDESICRSLQSKTGQVISIEYDSFFTPALSIDSTYLIRRVRP